MTELIHGIRYTTAAPHYRAQMDSLALAAFAPARGRVADLGCGAGLIGLLLCARSTSVRIVGLDFSPEAVGEARRNALENSLSDRAIFQLADLRERGALPPAGSFDGAVSNPPYQPASGGRSPDPARDAARCAAFCPLPALCGAAAYLVRPGGDFSLVYPAARLAEVFAALRESGFAPKRMRFVRHTADHPASLALICARRGGGAGLIFESDQIVRGPDGEETAAWRAVCDR